MGVVLLDISDKDCNYYGHMFRSSSVIARVQLSPSGMAYNGSSVYNEAITSNVVE